MIVRGWLESTVREVARNPKLVKYVDMPVQHTRERMLRAMRRGVTETSQKELIRKWRDLVPGLTFRTTVIVGFPGETEEDFDGMLADLRELRFERLGAFVYSREPGSRADALEGHLDEETKQKRYARVMQQQQELAFSQNRALVNRTFDVLVEKQTGKDRWEGRGPGDAPDIDTVVTLHGKKAEVAFTPLPREPPVPRSYARGCDGGEKSRWWRLSPPWRRAPC